MGGCVTGSKDPKTEILKKANQTFKRLDKNNNNQINATDIEKHFGSYSAASAKIMMREIDLDKDGIITYKQWMAYWQLVRRSGYTYAQILRQLNSIEEGLLTLNFPKTHTYQQDIPRTTVIQSIVNDLRRAPPQNLPFKIQD